MKHSSFTTITTMTTGDPAASPRWAWFDITTWQVAWKYSTEVDPDGAGDARAFSEVAPDVTSTCMSKIVVSYGLAARASIEAAFWSAGLESPDAQWIDCRWVADRVWSVGLGNNYSLTRMAEKIRHRYRPGEHHRGCQGDRGCAHRGDRGIWLFSRGLGEMA